MSRGTVSKVLSNNQGAQIARATRERIKKAAAEMGYHPSAVARGLAGKRMNTLGIVVAKENSFVATSPYFAAVLDGILGIAMRERQDTMLFTGHLWCEAEHHLPVFYDGRCDGLLLISPSVNGDSIPALLEAGIPFVLVNEHSSDPRVTTVGVDNVAAARDLTAYLLERGHRRIALLSGFPSEGNVADRREGYRRALEALGIGYDASLVVPGTYLEESGYERAQALMRLPKRQRPSALFCGSDQIALGVLRALEELGIRVPGDVSVTGFDDIPAAATSRPALTTVRQPMRRLGERSAELLLAHISGQIAGGRKEVLPTELIVRGSVAPPGSA